MQQYCVDFKDGNQDEAIAELLRYVAGKKLVKPDSPRGNFGRVYFVGDVRIIRVFNAGPLAPQCAFINRADIMVDEPPPSEGAAT